MGEEAKKPVEKKIEEKKAEEVKKPEVAEKKKKEEAKPEEKKEDKKSDETLPPPPPPPPQEVVLQIFMHCEGCAKKIRKCLINFPGVEDVITDCKTSKVVVKGEKAAADPLKVLERVQRKSHRKVELLSPIPKPPTEEEKKKAEEPEKPKPEEKKEEPPQPITAKLKVHMHCEACAEEIKKRILRMKGVDNAEPDLKSSIVTVTGLFDPPKLVEYVYKRTGKHAMIVPEPEKKEEEKEKKEEEKKAEEEKKDGGEEKKDGEEAKTEEEIINMVEMKRNEYYYQPQRYGMEYYSYPPPQIFSDENPNACSVM